MLLIQKRLCLLLLSCSFCVLLILPACSRRAEGVHVDCNEQGAEVLLDGQRVGRCPLDLQPAQGQHVLTLEKPIDARYRLYYQGKFIVGAGEAMKVKAELVRRFTEQAVQEFDRGLVPIRGGCFQMGNPFGDAAPDERPLHRVCLDDYSIGRNELTQAEWQQIMGENPARFQCGDCPIESVSYLEVQEFIRKLNALTGKNYRLPTEAEWEYAATGGGKAEKWAGTNEVRALSQYAWYRGNLDRTTHLVGLKKPNGLGLFDMTGNVEEMVQDRWGEYQDAPQRNPAGPDPSGRSNSVIRGGSYGSDQEEARVYARRSNATEAGRFYIGFRLARSTERGNR